MSLLHFACIWICVCILWAFEFTYVCMYISGFWDSLKALVIYGLFFYRVSLWAKRGACSYWESYRLYWNLFWYFKTIPLINASSSFLFAQLCGPLIAPSSTQAISLQGTGFWLRMVGSIPQLSFEWVAGEVSPKQEAFPPPLTSIPLWFLRNCTSHLSSFMFAWLEVCLPFFLEIFRVGNRD